MIINKICRKFKRTYLSSKRIKLAYPSCFPMLWLTFCLPRLHISYQFMAVVFYPREPYGSCAPTPKRVILNLKNFYVCHSILVITSLFPKRVLLIPQKNLNSMNINLSMAIMFSLREFILIFLYPLWQLHFS